MEGVGRIGAQQRFWLIVSAFALIVSGAAAMLSWRLHQDRAPFALAATRPTVTDLSVVAARGQRASNVARALRRLDTGESIDPIALPQRTGQQYVVGRFSMSAHRAPTGSQYALFVIDSRSHQVVSLMWPVNTHHFTLAAGWDYGMNAIGHRYRWLAPLAMSAQQDSSGQPAADPAGVFWRSGPAEDFAFYAVLPPDALPVARLGDLTVGLAFMGPDRQPWGAARLN